MTSTFDHSTTKTADRNDDPPPGRVSTETNAFVKTPELIAHLVLSREIARQEIESLQDFLEDKRVSQHRMQKEADKEALHIEALEAELADLQMKTTANSSSFLRTTGRPAVRPDGVRSRR